MKKKEDATPTMQLKWFRTEDLLPVESVIPLARVAGYPETGPEWYCLKQLWSDGEWRDIEVIV